jgi:pilus assembly protein Flp/PilA
MVHSPRPQPTKIAAALTKVTGRRVASAAARRRAEATAIRRKWRDVEALACGSLNRWRRRGTRVAIGWCATRRVPRTQTHNAASPHNRTAAIGALTLKGDVMQLVNFVKSFARNDEGQDLLEYALLVALIALVAVAAVTAAGSSVSTIFTSIAGKLVAPSS